MLLDEDMDTLIEDIGHDGSEIWWPDHPEPLQRRSFHIQEFLDICFKRGKIFAYVEAILTLGDPWAQRIKKQINGDHEKRFSGYLRNFKGVILGDTPEGIGHAVAWDRKMIYDPRGFIQDSDNSDLGIHSFYPLIDL